MAFVRYNAVSRTAARALEEFDDSFRGALAVADPESLWAAQHGLLAQSDALKLTFPIPLDAVGYHEFKGEMKYRRLYSRALSMKSKTWADGVEEFEKVITAPDFIDWQSQPGNMAREWTRLPNQLVAVDILEGNPVLDFYRNPDTGAAGSRQLFASDHPFNVLKSAVGDFDNDIDTTQAEILNGTFFKTIKKYARSIKGPNGKPMGLRATGGVIICNGEREDLLDEALKLDTVIRVLSDDGAVTPPATVGTAVAAVTQQNRHKNTMSYLVADELTSASDDYLYVILDGRPEAHPWIVMQESAPEVIICDTSDQKYKDTGKVSYGSRGEANVAAGLPHRIVRVHITG